MKTLLDEYLAAYGHDLTEELKDGAKMEVCDTDQGTIYLARRIPIVYEADGKLRPTLLFQGHIRCLPRVVVDQGAVPYVCRGADVMRPGVKKLEGEFEEGALVAVVDEKHGKAIAVGHSLRRSEALLEARRGPVVKVQHHVGDKLWKVLRTL